MGSIFFRASGTPDHLKPGEPDPTDWVILRKARYNDLMIVEIQYPDCKNYEGKKILVMPRDKYVKAKRTGVLDPHFTEDKYILARFEPTERGWNWAHIFVTSITSPL